MRCPEPAATVGSRVIDSPRAERSTVPRVARQIVLALAAGAVVSVLIAWALVIAEQMRPVHRMPPLPWNYDPPLASEDAMRLWHRYRPEDAPVDEVRHYQLDSTWYGFEVIDLYAGHRRYVHGEEQAWNGSEWLSFCPEDEPPEYISSVNVVQAGWPRPCLEGALAGSIDFLQTSGTSRLCLRYDLDLGDYGTARIPLRPMPGLLANSVIFGAPIWFAMFGIGAAWRALRRRRWRCTRCGYDVRNLERCPECGTDVGRRRS